MNLDEAIEEVIGHVANGHLSTDEAISLLFGSEDDLEEGLKDVLKKTGKFFTKQRRLGPSMTKLARAAAITGTLAAAPVGVGGLVAHGDYQQRALEREARKPPGLRGATASAESGFERRSPEWLKKNRPFRGAKASGGAELNYKIGSKYGKKR